MNLLIKKGKSVDQKSNAHYFFQDDQWFNLTAHDMRRTLVNAGMIYHRPQIIPGTPLANSTSPPSPAPIKSPIHLELTQCDSISTATPVKKPCPVNTSCDHIPDLDHPSTSLEPQDHSIVGSAEPESILNWILSVSHHKPHASLKLKPTYHQQMFSLGTMTMRLMHHMTISIIMSHMPVKSKIKIPSSLMPPSKATLLHYPKSWTSTIVKTRSLLTLQAQSQPLSKSPVITLCILSVLIT